MLRPPSQKAYYLRMDKEKTELYTDCLICNQGLATATSLSAMLDGEVSHLCPRGYGQITRHLCARLYTSKDLWIDVKPVVRQIEKDDACLIFDDTVQEKAFTDENEIMCWHYDPCKGRLGFRHQPVERAVPQR